VVHHGGAGTLHASARSGRPTLIAQIFGDQPAHAVLVNERGFGLSLKSMPKDLYMNWGLVAKRLKNSGLQSKTNVGPQNVGTKERKLTVWDISKSRDILCCQKSPLERK
jgi:hypothetical protein